MLVVSSPNEDGKVGTETGDVIEVFDDNGLNFVLHVLRAMSQMVISTPNTNKTPSTIPELLAHQAKHIFSASFQKRPGCPALEMSGMSS